MSALFASRASAPGISSLAASSGAGASPASRRSASRSSRVINASISGPATTVGVWPVAGSDVVVGPGASGRSGSAGSGA